MFLLRSCLLVVALLFVPALSAAESQRPPNVLFLAIDDLRNDLGAFGAAHARTPQLDRFAASARLFTNHYVQVPTCGASRAALLRGRYPTEAAHVANSAIATTHPRWGDANLPAWFQRHGYRTLALGKITHHPGGLTGKQWAEGPEELPGSWERSWIPDTPWKTAEGMMHAYANGKPRTPGQTPPWESFDGPDTAYPDAWIATEAVATLRQLATSAKPWFLAVGLFKPHLPFSAPKRYFDLHDPAKVPEPENQRKPEGPTGWHKSGEFRGNYGHNGRDPDTDADYARLARRAYAAATSYVDAQAGRVLEALASLGLDDNTIVVVWGDHGFLLGEHAIWGKHCLYENALRSPLMIRAPGIVRQPGRETNAIVETVDLFPTLVDLCALPKPADLDGRSLRPHLVNPESPTTKPALGFWTNGQRTIRTERWRLISHPAADAPAGSPPAVELFDLRADPHEARNLAAAEPGTVASLLERLTAPFPAATRGKRQ